MTSHRIDLAMVGRHLLKREAARRPPVAALVSPSQPAVIESAKGFAGWLESSRPGDRATYHSGTLTADRIAPGGEGLSALAAAVMAAADRDLVAPFQCRAGEIGDGRFQYLAVRTFPAAGRRPPA